MTGSFDKNPRQRIILIRVVLWTALILFLGSVISGAWFLSYVLNPGPDTVQKTAVVYIPRGTPSKEIGRLLAEKELIHDDIRFLLVTRVLGRSAKLQAGEFRLHTGQNPINLIKELSEAGPVEHSVTIPEGLNVEEIATILAKDGWADKKSFIAYCSDNKLIHSLGLGAIGSLEGYLFPDTYNLVRPAKDEVELIKMLVGRSLSVWQELAAIDDNKRLSRHEIFTLASIVEKESGDKAERPIIAAVFLNRLQKKMKLQSDPTVIYGIKGFAGNLTRRDLKTPTPYNTYTIPALPPGPIGNPGEESLKAVLSPARVDYLYFVSKNDGTHYFSKTLREHNRAVRKYQRNKNKQLVK